MIRPHRTNLHSLLPFTLAVLLLGCGGGKESSPTPSALPGFQVVLGDYERIRDALAADDLEGAVSTAGELLAHSADTLAGLPPSLVPARTRTESAAASLARADDLQEARSAFSFLSHGIIDLAEGDPGHFRSLYLFECPMVDGFNLWVQPSPELENPYMGTRMPGCGSRVPWEQVAKIGDGPAAEPAGDGIAFYTCPMHPSVRAADPGQCPICSMDLVAVSRAEAASGTVLVDDRRRQLIGLRTEAAEVRPASVRIRALGRIVVDETRTAAVTLKVGGWIRTLYADATGMPVRAGEPLFTLYSPELLSAQEEYLTALGSRAAAGAGGAPERSDYLVKAARERLLLWDLTEAQIRELAERNEPQRYVPILSPVSGFVMEKNVVAGSAVEPGQTLLRISDLDRIWIEAELYEGEVDLVAAGTPVRISLPYLPERDLAGRISYVYPYLDPASRTGRVRIELENPGLELRPGMYANVRLTVDRGPRLLVPESAVLYAGDRTLVFLDEGDGKLRPVDVVLGLRAVEGVEVLTGIEAGDEVVTSGNFLIAAESRLKSATEAW
jgi:Cu(I)/Ag(I) efflux system membrane fusion protein